MQNLKKMLKNKMLLAVATILVIVVFAVVVNQILVVKKAHSTFDNYYAFRGCVQLLSTTTDSGTCRTGSGQIIKIVEVGNRWYLNGDLPVCWLNRFCF
jgi:hypothetical protein